MHWLRYRMLMNYREWGLWAFGLLCICTAKIKLWSSVRLSMYILASAKNVCFRRFYNAANFRPISQLLLQSRCSATNYDHYSSSSSPTSSSSSSSAPSGPDKTANDSLKSAQASADAAASAPTTGKTETAKPGIPVPTKPVSEIVYKRWY